MKRFDRIRLVPARQGLAAALFMSAAVGSALPADVSHGSDGIRIAIAPFAQDWVDPERAAEKSEGSRGPFSWWGGESASEPAEPIESETPTLPVAQALADELARRALDRLIPPGSFVARRVFDPEAEEVREWAYNAAVQQIVVGRVSTPKDGDGPGPRVEAVVRSGHSGAQLTRHEVILSGAAELPAASAALARSILDSLGYESPGTDGDGEPAVAGGARAANGSGNASKETSSGAAGHGLDGALAGGGFQEDAPIEIQADEAEIISRGDDRELVFQSNVLVRQADVTLRSDRLEALYRKGESEPRKLVAKGRVKVDQAGRRAFCDKATYVRESQLLTCFGHAQLVQGCDIVRGEKIVFDLSNDRARVDGAASIVIQPEEQPDGSCLTTKGLL